MQNNDHNRDNASSKNNSASSNFLKTDKGKTKSNAIEVPSISLPKGGGAIKSIDEKFSVNAVNGTAVERSFILIFRVVQQTKKVLSKNFCQKWQNQKKRPHLSMIS